LNAASVFGAAIAAEQLQPGLVSLWREDSASLTVQRAACAADYGLFLAVGGVIATNISEKRRVLRPLPIFYVAFALSGSKFCRKVHMLLDS
jgi:hypothetical protein